MSVSRAQREIDSAEYTEWLAYAQIERFGPQIEDLRAGLAAAAIYNVHRDSKRHPKMIGPGEVVPWFEREAAANDEPVLLDDANAQSNLICASLFRMGAGNG